MLSKPKKCHKSWYHLAPGTYGVGRGAEGGVSSNNDTKEWKCEQRPGSEAEMCGGEGGCLLGFSKGQGGPSRAEI